jgi:hypothetical protein
MVPKFNGFMFRAPPSELVHQQKLSQHNTQKRVVRFALENLFSLLDMDLAKRAYMLYYAKNIKICYMWWFCDDFDNAGAVL